MRYGGFSYSECYKLPVQYRTWFIDRIVKEVSKEKNANRSARNTRNNSNMTRRFT